jgi:hypothetical protein
MYQQVLAVRTDIQRGPNSRGPGGNDGVKKRYGVKTGFIEVAVSRLKWGDYYIILLYDFVGQKKFDT